MRAFKFVLLACVSVSLIGCGKATNRSVADGVDLEAIRAYEESVNAVQKYDASVNVKQQAIAEEKEAAAAIKKAADGAQTASP